MENELEKNKAKVEEQAKIYNDKRIGQIDQELQKLRTKDRLFKSFKEYEGQDRVVPIAELIKELKERNGLSVFDLKTKLLDLDKIIGGFREGQLVVLSAPTGQGKTSLFQTLTKNFQEQDIQSLWFSYEMPPDAFIENFPGIPYFFLPRELVTGKTKWIEERIIEGIAKYGTKAIFIDHLHFLIEMKDLAIARNQSILIGMLLRNLKEIALNYGIVIFLIAHLRKIDTQTEIPTIDDLRDSSFVAQESDLVMLLWRKQVEQTQQQKKDKMPIELLNEAILSVVKNRRTGKLGFMSITYNEMKNEFLPVSYQKEEKIDEEIPKGIDPRSIFDQ